MARDSICPCGDPDLNRKKNGNCSIRLGDDGLNVQCVGAWARSKHDYLQRYIEATRSARARYLPPRGQGGAAFIDLFAGPGIACDRDTGELIDGSPLIALKHSGAPFSKLILCDWDDENTDALTSRFADENDRSLVIRGDSNANVAEILRLVPQHGLNFALIDPFSPKVLKWETIRTLGESKRMDFIIHFPTGPLKRNFEEPGFDRVIDEAVGTESWRSEVSAASDVPKLIDFLRQSLAGIGYEGDKVRSLPIRNSRQGVLYHLVYASKHSLGNKIWTSVARMAPGGQREIGFD